MLNKLEFNNLIICNKKCIQKARAQTIAKLVQKLRKLKESIEKNPEKCDKQKERTRVYEECLVQLKSLKPVDIMRKVLLLDGFNPNTVLTNGRATPEEIGVAMLALNQIMLPVLVKFRQNLKLSKDPDAKWRQEILELSKRQVKVERTEQKRQKRKELKEHKVLERNRLEWLEQNKVPGDVEDLKPVVDDTKTAVKVEKKVPAVKKTVKSSHKQMNKNSSEEKNKLKPKADLDPIPTAKSRPEPKSRGKKKRFDSDKERPTHVADPFFITESGQPYMSTAVVLSGDSDSDENESDHESQRLSHKNANSRPKTDFNERKRNNDRHPSWVAKEKQKPIITSFKGSKIKFDDDANITETIPAAAATASNPTKHIPEADDANAGMHPSWIAKQKLKPKIATFVGTKIKFDDD